ncbi:hypothetical protein CpB0167 [Chlamydia pneumoniae TW-183]|uniref:Uncharacterized protein n=2 Tax=Chlamydia pneumoniae TaxID=83558 RepID=Q9Z918_CHLPN|nr:hypothetical protein [Chlamydia pneumoniae]AAD18319.1 hypothetical protein CPn_0166 [Chlamydia pneumoniae CWL029]AAF38421.1 hypothetical protein CP_0605 [Chlamydia pneumoniae AR39]AAP98100.1 hypothetical protein CpB0167 [Chlamydia pneumoniae TW-183]CRI32664.1 Uncharacterized protein BN1224_Wien1_A_01710 [Chlamydia pneumoniae]CRI35525.1 Uncharacterized protein BN1224_CM1_A_01720 [Chlamydia pneumoniae]
MSESINRSIHLEASTPFFIKLTNLCESRLVKITSLVISLLALVGAGVTLVVLFVAGILPLLPVLILEIILITVLVLLFCLVLEPYLIEKPSKIKELPKVDELSVVETDSTL